MARRRRVKRNAGVGSVLLPLAIIGGGAWLGYREYMKKWGSYSGEKRNGREIRIYRTYADKPPKLVIDEKTGKQFKTIEAFDAWAKNIQAVETLKEKLTKPGLPSLLGLNAFSMPQDPTVVDLNQDPMSWDETAGRMKTSQHPRSDSFTSTKPEIIPGVPTISKGKTSLPNLGKLSLILQSVIMREAQADATMVPYVKELLSQSNPEKAVYQALRKAMENQLNPKKYPELAGRWLLARKYFSKRMGRGLGLSGLGEEQKFYMATPSGYKEVAQKGVEAVAKMTKTDTSSSTASAATSGIASLLASLTGSLVDVAKPALETMLTKNLKVVAKQAQAAVKQTVTKEDTDAKAEELAKKEMERLAKEEQGKVQQQSAEAGGIPTALIVVPIVAAAIPVLFGRKH